MTKSAIIHFIFLLLCFSAIAQTKITGYVYNSSGFPVQGAEVSILETNERIITNSKGYFEIEVIPNTTLTLVIYHVNFNSYTESFNLKNGQEIIKHIHLQYNSIPDVIIEPKKIRKKKNDSFFEIDTKALETTVSTSENIEAILFSEASTSSNNELSSQYSVRGGNFDENLVYVNDIEVYRPFLVRSGQQEGLSFVNSDMVENINFSAGGFGAIYGDKMSSVLDIKYRVPDSLRAGFRASLLGGALHIEDRSLRFNYILGARYKSNAYLLSALETNGEYKPSFFDVQTFITYNANENWRISFLGNISENKFRMVPEDKTTTFGTIQTALKLRVFFEGEEKDEFKTYFGALTSEHDVGKRTLLKFIFSGYQSSESETFDIDGAYLLNEVESNFGSDNFGESTYQIGYGRVLNHTRNYLTANVFNLSHKGYYYGKKMDWYWGTKIQKEIFHDQINEWQLIDSSGYSIPTSPADEIQLFNVLKTEIDLNSNRSTAYLQNELTLDSSKIHISSGIRMNYWDYNNQTTVSPRFSAYYNPNPDSTYTLFKLAIGYYHQPPFYRELRDFSGVLNPLIRAQTSIHFVLGNEYFFKAWDRDFKLTTEIYYKHLDNLIPFVVDNVRIRYNAKNNSQGFATGFETKVYGDFVPGLNSWFTLGVMKTMENIKDDSYYTYVDANGETVAQNATNIADSTIHFPGFIPRPTDQRLSLGIHFQDEMPNVPSLKMHFSLLYGSGLPFGPPQSEKYQHIFRMPAYRRVDVGFSFQIIENGKLIKKDKNVKIPDNHFLKGFDYFVLRMEVFNLLEIDNTISYFWVDDISGNQFGVPNHLTTRLINFKVIGKI